MPNRCPETTVIEIEGDDLELRCVEWLADSDGRHEGVHHVSVSPALGHVREWMNENLP
jgi:hypothetical protein